MELKVLLYLTSINTLKHPTSQEKISQALIRLPSKFYQTLRKDELVFHKLLQEME